MPPPALVNGISTLFNAKKFADLLIRCGDSQWYAHRNVLCMQSEYFDKACESCSKEDDKGIIELHGDDPDIVRPVLEYLYTGRYSNDSSAIDNVRVFVLAEKYCIDSLLSVAAYQFALVAYKSWATDGFADAIFEVYTSTNDVSNLLRNGIIDTVMMHCEDFFNPRDCPLQFKRALVELPGFAAEVAQALAEDVEQERNIGIYRCPKKQCNGTFRSKMKPGQKADWWCPQCDGEWVRTFADWQIFRNPFTIIDGYWPEDAIERTKDVKGEE